MIKHLQVVRTLILKIGSILHQEQLLDHPDTIFLLHQDELLRLAELIAHSDQFRATITARKEQYMEDSALRLPGIIDDLDHIAVPAQQAQRSGTQSLHGTGASVGQVRGRARVIESITTINTLEPGDILVTDHTDPGWTPVFPVIEGVVTNTGGLLSHAAVVAREYGLPAVVNVPHATEHITDGQVIELDGSSGEIRLLP
jgi:pyruvate,water dikinase